MRVAAVADLSDEGGIPGATGKVPMQLAETPLGQPHINARDILSTPAARATCLEVSTPSRT
jgi:hypothetical protein